VIVAHGHLGYVAARVVFIFFFAYKSALEGLGGIFNAITVDSVGRDFDQLGWSFDRPPVLQLDLRVLRFDSPHRAQQSILLLRAVKDSDCRPNIRILCLRGNSERQDSSPQHKSRQKPPHNTIHLDSSNFK
jgi:hypothetical protein